MGSCLTVSRSHGNSVLALLLLLDGRLVSASIGGTFCVWDLAAAGTPAVLRGHEGAVLSLAVLPDGRLASGSIDRTLRWCVKCECLRAC